MSHHTQGDYIVSLRLSSDYSYGKGNPKKFGLTTTTHKMILSTEWTV